MPTTSRLATIAPEVEDALRLLPAERRSAVAVAAARWAVGQALPSDPRIAEWLETGRQAELDALAKQLDETYLGLSEATTGRTSNEVVSAFARARAVSAAAFALRGEADEALYEALHSTDRLNELKAFVLGHAHTV